MEKNVVVTRKLSPHILLKFGKLHSFPRIRWWNKTNLQRKLIAFGEKSLSCKANTGFTTKLHDFMLLKRYH